MPRQVVLWAETRNIQLIKVLYCKLPTNGKQQPAFPLEHRPGTSVECVTTLPPLPPPCLCYEAEILPVTCQTPRDILLRYNVLTH